MERETKATGQSNDRPKLWVQSDYAEVLVSKKIYAPTASQFDDRPKLWI